MARARLSKTLESSLNYILLLSTRFSYCRGGSGGLMQVELRIRDITRRGRLRLYVERRLRFAVSRFGNRVGRVVVRMGRVNGIPGVFAAIDRAARRAERLVAHRLERARESKTGRSQCE